MVRNDWYFRESLRAIRDWEAILDRWDKEMPGKAPAPVLPVPANGKAFEWSNPFPALLLPEEDRGLRVAGAAPVDGKIEVERSRPGEKARRNTFKPGETILGYKHPGGGGKDQWYHAYQRRFDRLTQFTAQPSPLAVGWRRRTIFRRGEGCCRPYSAIAAKSGWR